MSQFEKKDQMGDLLVNSSLALMPVTAGFVTYDIFFLKHLQFEALILILFLIQNFVICMLWRVLKNYPVRSATFFAGIIFPWGIVTVAIWQGLSNWTMSASALSTSVLKSKLNSSELTTSSDLLSGDRDAGSLYQIDAKPMDGDSKLCALGQSQSPVDIPKRAPLIPVNWRVVLSPETVTMVKDEYHFGLKFSGKNKMTINKKIYVLTSLTFHSPSEHLVRGLNYPLEIQAMWQTQDDHRVMLVGYFVNIGTENKNFADIITGLGNSNQEISNLPVSKILPQDGLVYRYSGSLTEPPCTEGVVWNIFAKPLEFSEEQIKTIRTHIHMNARPVQWLGRREFDSKI